MRHKQQAGSTAAHGRRFSRRNCLLLGAVAASLTLLVTAHLRLPQGDSPPAGPHQLPVAASRWIRSTRLVLPPSEGGCQGCPPPRSRLQRWAAALLQLWQSRSEPAQANDACSVALGGLPRVALLFLTRRAVAQETAWRMWLDTAAGQLPAAAVQAACARDASNLKRVQHACARTAFAGSLASQHLFTIYVHPSPEYKGFPTSSVFWGREIRQRIKVLWGTHTMITATRALLAEALAQRANAKFVLLSESELPLYPPQVVYLQLLGEPRSRINACSAQGLLDGEPPDWWESSPLAGAAWRKSSQWVALNRAHAQLVVDDNVFDPVFQQRCVTDLDPEHDPAWYHCFSDEHYIPSLLASLGRANETDCLGYLTSVDWATNTAHPVAYKPADITAQRLRELRLSWDWATCADLAAIRSAAQAFVRMETLSADMCSSEAAVPRYNASLLTPECPLFARKFHAAAARTVVSTLLESCTNGLFIVGSQCPLVKRLVQPANRTQPWLSESMPA